MVGSDVLHKQRPAPAAVPHRGRRRRKLPAIGPFALRPRVGSSADPRHPMTMLSRHLSARPDLQPLGEALRWRPALIALHAVSRCADRARLPGHRRGDRRRRSGGAATSTRERPRSSPGSSSPSCVTASLTHLADAPDALARPIYGARQALLKVADRRPPRTRPPSPSGRSSRGSSRCPRPRDLARANLRWSQANASLETTVAWRTHELERANQRFEQAMARSNITVFTQDTDLRYTWIHNPQARPRPPRRCSAAPPRRCCRRTRPTSRCALKRRALETGADGERHRRRRRPRTRRGSTST